MPKYTWVGSYSIEEILRRSLDNRLPKPPETGSAYLVSARQWKRQPLAACLPLYVGGITGKSTRFRTRIGDLIADMFGFYGGLTGHHSGGQSLHRWCIDQKKNPLELYLGWVRDCRCHRCLEVDLFETFGVGKTLLNKVRPSVCKKHP